MAKRSRQRQTGGGKGAQARGAVVDLKGRIPPELFSPKQAARPNPGAPLSALFAEIPMDEIWTAHPPARQEKGVLSHG